MCDVVWSSFASAGFVVSHENPPREHGVIIKWKARPLYDNLNYLCEDPVTSKDSHKIDGAKKRPYGPGAKCERC
jgi:hypothetical protein